MAATPASTLIRSARSACEAVAVGPFTPIAFERYEFIGGERGWMLGYPSETLGGHGCIVWSSRSQWPAIRPARQGGLTS